MKSTISAVRTVWDHLNKRKSQIPINGGIYWLNRPKNSVKEDIVVSALAMDAKEVQEGVINVNIHVPNPALSNDDTQPNFTRFEQISDNILPMLADVWGVDWNFLVDEPGTIVPDGNNWFCNIRIRYYTVRQ